MPFLIKNYNTCLKYYSILQYCNKSLMELKRRMRNISEAQLTNGEERNE